MHTSNPTDSILFTIFKQRTPKLNPGEIIKGDELRTKHKTKNKYG